MPITTLESSLPSLVWFHARFGRDSWAMVPWIHVLPHYLALFQDYATFLAGRWFYVCFCCDLCADYVPDIVEKREPWQAQHNALALQYLDEGTMVVGGAAGSPVDGAFLIFHVNHIEGEFYLMNFKLSSSVHVCCSSNNIVFSRLKPVKVRNSILQGCARLCNLILISSYWVVVCSGAEICWRRSLCSKWSCH